MSNKITPFLQEVVYIVADFLESIQHVKQATKLKKQFEIPEWVKKDNPLIKKGLKKVLKDYINDNEKVLKYYKNRKNDQSDNQSQPESEQQPQPVKKSKKSVSPKNSPLTKPKSPKVQTKKAPQPTQPKGWMASQFQQPKRLEDLNDNHQVEQQQEPEVVIPKQKKQKQSKNSKKVAKKQTSSEQQSQEQSEETPKHKKQKKQIKKQKKQKKVKGPVDTSYLNSQDQFQLQGKKAKKSVTPQKKVQPKNTSSVVTRKRSAQIQQQTVQQKTKKAQTIVKNHTPKPVYQKNSNEQQQNTQKNGDGFPKQFFSRINKNQVGFIPQNRRDNTFEAKQRYGAGDAWGQYGHEKLKDTRGDSFKKTKGKLKNKAFQGSGININQINSVPIM